MWRRLFEKHDIKVTIISCGDSGQEIGAGIISTLKEYGVSSKSLAVTSEFEEHAKGKLFDERISIDDQHD
ncbi:MAG: hypothetical protein ACW99F_18520, partial [Candidatus Hodarchaeales archaeon]